MGLFSRKRRAADASEEVPWFAGEPGGDELELEIDANRNAAFTDDDLAWLRDDPGAEIRARRDRER